MRARRLELGWTQIQLAKKLKVKQPVVSDLENDRTAPSLDVVYRVAKALETPASELVCDPAEKSPTLA